MALSSESTALFDTSALESLNDARVAIVTTEWNDAIINALVEGCKTVLAQHSANIAWEFKVPGTVELTFACSRLMQLGEIRPEAIIAFGAVIRGGTPHFDYVCDSVTQGLTSLNTRGEVPVIFGVLTLDNEAQAWERLGGSHGHKGEEAALAALKMIALNRALNTKK
jgi:6,7-dimethyl-8-ribityllumazine synthase